MEVETVEVPTEGMVAEDLIEEAAVKVALIEEAAVKVALIEEDLIGADLTKVQERCIKLFVQIAIKNAKFLLNQQKANQYIAEIVFRNTNQKDLMINFIMMHHVNIT